MSQSDAFDAVLEDYLTRIDNGESPDRKQFLTKYPEHADQLGRFFEDWDVVDSELAREKAAFHERIAQLGATDNNAGFESGAVPPQIRGFKVLEEVGSGSQGFVFKAEQLGTRRLVALKVVREGVFASKGERRRFEIEVELASRLDHPGIAAVYECGEDSGRAYYAMQYIDGDSLDVYLSTRTLTVLETLDLFLQICDAITYAHQRGVIHRDLKPSNMLVDSEDRVHIVDFGLAKAVSKSDSSAATRMTRVGDFAGTWFYASPEQVKREPGLIDIRTDVYALGVILFELLTDCYPYQVQDESRETIADHILNTEPTRPSAIRRDIERDLETIVLHALNKDPDRRYQTAGALGDDIHRYLCGQAVEARRDSPWYVLHKAARRYRWQITVAATTIAVLFVFAITISVLFRQAQKARATTEARMAIVRNSQAFSQRANNEANWAVNRLRPEVRDELQRMEFGASFSRTMDDWDDPAGILEIPPWLVKAVRATDDPRHQEGTDWLTDNDQALAELARRILDDGLGRAVMTLSESGLAIGKGPAGLGPILRVGDALLALSIMKFRSGRDEEAVESLELVRSIAIQIGDGRMRQHKLLSNWMRSNLYASTLIIFHELGITERSAPYIDWALADPPLIIMRPAIVEERIKTAQLLQGATFGDKPGSPGYIDLDTLDESSGGTMSSVRPITDEHRALARRTNPVDFLAVLDSYFAEVALWDPLPLPELNDRFTKLAAELERDPLWTIVKLIQPSLWSDYRFQCHARTQRAAVLLAAHLSRYAAIHGAWPADLSAAVPQGAIDLAIDPCLTVPFGYSVSSEGPLLYSINEDGTDNGGRPGNWGESDTDVVFLPPIP